MCSYMIVRSLEANDRVRKRIRRQAESQNSSDQKELLECGPELRRISLRRAPEVLERNTENRRLEPEFDTLQPKRVRLELALAIQDELFVDNHHRKR